MQGFRLHYGLSPVGKLDKTSSQKLEDALEVGLICLICPIWTRVTGVMGLEVLPGITGGDGGGNSVICVTVSFFHGVICFMVPFLP